MTDPTTRFFRILRHVLLYNPLIAPATRQSYLAMQHGPELFSKLNPDPSKPSSFQLSQLGALLSGELELSVPVFPVYGPLEDIRVLEKFRTGEYEVKNLCVLDESMTRSIEIGGVKLRLFGLGGGLQMHRICKSFQSLALTRKLILSVSSRQWRGKRHHCWR